MVWSSDIIAFSIQTANIVCPPLSLCFQLCWLCALTRCLHGVKKYEFQPLQAHKILASHSLKRKELLFQHLFLFLRKDPNCSC